MEMRRLTIALDVCALWLLLLVVACRLEVTTAGSGGGAHPHQGVVQPFRAGDPGIKIDKAAEKLLDQGKPYQTQIQSGSAGRGLVVQDVAAPTQVVWDRILDFNSYSKMVPKTMESQIYKREKAGRGGAERIWVRMKVGFTPAPRLTFFVNHLYQPQLNSMTWTLDYSRKSDFDDSCGYWYVLPHPQNKEWTRVYYSVEVSMFSWVPKFVVDFMSKQALTDATGWVKKYSEMEYAKAGPTTSDTMSSRKTSFNPLTRIFGGRLDKSKEGSSTERVDQVDEEKEKSPPVVTAPSHKVSPATLTRYVLASTALALVGCNIYLFVSQ